MLEKFLSIPNSFGLLWLVLTLLSVIITVIIARYKKIEWDDALMGWMVSHLTIIIFCSYGISRVERINVSDYQWKQIYTNDIDAKVTLEPAGFFVNSNGKIVVEAGQALGENAHLFEVGESNRPNRINYDIVAKTDKEIVTKRVELSNVIVDGEITKNSKIIKIEYRPYKGYYQKLGSTTGDMIPALEGSAEIRVTIQNEEGQKLNDLFKPAQ